MNFSINKTNKFGNPQYVENGEIIEFNPTDFWSIKDPQLCINYILNKYPGSELRTYNNIQYILSPKASLNIPKENQGNGSAIILEFDYLGKTYYLFTTDNKSYIQICQGSSNDGETFEQTIIRETKEELEITLTNVKEVGEYSFADYNDLIDYKRVCTTKVFHAKLQFQDVAHLVKNWIFDNLVNVFKVNNDETEYVVVVDKNNLDNVPEYVEEIQIKKKINGIMQDAPILFWGHHLEAVRQYTGLQPKHFTGYLNTFTMN